jgi:hypothetical protein
VLPCGQTRTLDSSGVAFYYQNANQFLTELHVPNATGKQTLGQW